MATRFHRVKSHGALTTRRPSEFLHLDRGSNDCYKRLSRRDLRRRSAQVEQLASSGSAEGRGKVSGLPFIKRARLALALLAATIGLSVAVAQQTGNPNEREVKPEPNAQDKDDITKPDSKIWVLDFKFKDPRLIKVDVPAAARRVCWYLWYQVINNTRSRTRSSPISSWSRTTGESPSTTTRSCRRCRTRSSKSRTRPAISRSRIR